MKNLINTRGLRKLWNIDSKRLWKSFKGPRKETRRAEDPEKD